MWWIIGAIYVLNITSVYVLHLWFEYKYSKSDFLQWKDKSFSEYVYSEKGVDTDNPLYWVGLLFPFVSIITTTLAYVLVYKKYIDPKPRTFNPVRLIMKLILRKKYLLERVSKEI